MEKEFIPYEQALEMKQLGFDEPCFAAQFAYENKLDNHITFCPTSNADGYKNSDGEHVKMFLEDEYYISRPSFSQSFRWFREKYKSHSRVDIQDVELDWYSFEILEVRDGDYNNDLHTDMNFKSHEEAELECLKKLIEIVKNKQ